MNDPDYGDYVGRVEAENRALRAKLDRIKALASQDLSCRAGCDCWVCEMRRAILKECDDA